MVKTGYVSDLKKVRVGLILLRLEISENVIFMNCFGMFWPLFYGSNWWLVGCMQVVESRNRYDKSDSESRLVGKGIANLLVGCSRRFG